MRKYESSKSIIKLLSPLILQKVSLSPFLMPLIISSFFSAPKTFTFDWIMELIRFRGSISLTRGG